MQKLKFELTLGHEDRGDGEEPSDNHTNTQDPPSAPVVHDEPAEQVGRDLDHGREKERHVFIAAKSGSIVAQTHVNSLVGNPKKKTSFLGEKGRIFF